MLEEADLPDARPESADGASSQAGGPEGRSSGAASRPAVAAPAASSGGVLAAIRRNPRAWLIAAGVAAAVVLGGSAIGVGAAVGSPRAVAVPTSSPTPTPVATTPPPSRPTPSAAPTASKLRTCSVATLAQDPRLDTLDAQVVNPQTGEVLFDRNGSTPAATASVMKVLTASAALNVLGPNYQIPTTVVKGSQPGQVVLVGGGDLTLSSLPSGEDGYYKGAAHLSDLASQTQKAWDSDPSNNGQPITSVVLDSSLFSGPTWLPSWDEHEERVVEGSTSYITALQVDGDRDDPTALESPRSTDPVGNVGNDFAGDLDSNPAITDGTAPAGAQQLGQVLSPPVSELVTQALQDSDNDIMEMLARLVAIKEGKGNTFSAIDAGTKAALASYGIPTDGLTLVDGSGLSGDNRVPPSFLTQLMGKILARQGSLGTIYDALPVAGQSGTLGPGYDRFQGSSSIVDGAVNAKTGWIDTAYTLSGIVHAKDGTALTFAIFAEGDNVQDDAKVAIDNLVAGIFSCGNNLSNN